MFPVNLIHDKSQQAGLEYLIIGGHAINAYCEPRATLDVDFLVRKSDLTQWRRLLEEEGFKLMHEGRTFVRFSPPYGVEWRLDLMLVNDQTFEKMRADARTVNIIGIQSCIPRPEPEHLIALKLHALKHGHPERFEKDFGDVIALTRNAGCDVRSDGYRQLCSQFGTPELHERILQRLG
jgi:hypothetical protein